MARRPILASVLALTMLAAVVHQLSAPLVFVAASPATRGSAKSSFAGAEQAVMPTSLVSMQALPEPRPNDNMLPVDLNRTSLYWGLLTILILAILFSSFLFN
mmetsp:Transcript_54965/g.131013  ORF Transcript_54965/g.131013 Transcript_54965/m.131013 type:complete len:102 (+) Transcript_54965:88-393(+)|eukprot:CAMPEP_0178403274 /NCGR_PEP_ID=MMETSP0689_2-20121128/17282_1 /TAXON_ID=160604 /ORGANISM="Amphidinium massartii, Strain CS-259" /LENGTH=101 /DNA_ID=CAMNT_0020024219 /DNA_START=172 /DNA_END=477 /DNA_ORIENTATION=+